MYDKLYALCISIYQGCCKAGKQQAKILYGLLNAEKYINIQVYKRIRCICGGAWRYSLWTFVTKRPFESFFQIGIEGRKDPESL